MDINVKFSNSEQRDFYYSTARNQCFSGGFNNGKTFGGSLKAITLLTTFPGYRMIIAREVYADLKRTTMQSFFKQCPSELIESNNWQDGLTVLKNKSQINWMHLDKVEENSLRGIEPNSILVDQAEETKEQTYDVLDGRVGRWDGAIIPEALLKANPNWPKSKQGKHIAPSYMMLLCNPDTQYHYIYRKYHPDSLERLGNHFFVEGAWDPTLGSEETYLAAMRKGDEYVEKYVKGVWGVSNAQIHRLRSESLLEYSPELIDHILRKGNLFRVLDHGDSSPTSCLWFAALDGIFICYREYYVPNQVISYHRQAIHDLSGNEVYSGNYADPQIFKKTAQKQGGFWSVSDEYMTRDLDSKPLYWIPADNNEFATRNRVNELLSYSAGRLHPITKEPNSPGIYFIKRSPEYPQGCFHAINELQSQRRKLIGYIDGKAYYSDDREESITDHSYDCVRYFVAMHGSPLAEKSRPIKPMTFKWFKVMRDRQKNLLAPASQ